jgi:hypothetical protein
MKPIFSTQLFFSFLGLTSLTNIHHAPRRTQGADMYLPRDRREQRKPGGRESCRGGGGKIGRWGGCGQDLLRLTFFLRLLLTIT